MSWRDVALLVVVEAVVWRALLPRLAAGLDLDDLR